MAYVAAVGRLFIQHLPELEQCASEQGRRLLLDEGTDDESSAHRWKVIHESHRRCNLCAFWCKRRNQVMFFELLGNPFGAASAFLKCNQGPELTISAARMLMSVPCAHFYDDLLSLGLNLERGSG